MAAGAAAWLAAADDDGGELLVPLLEQAVTVASSAAHMAARIAGALSLPCGFLILHSTLMFDAEVQTLRAGEAREAYRTFTSRVIVCNHEIAGDLGLSRLDHETN